MNRRAFVQILSAAGASAAVKPLGAQATGDQSTPTLYFVDGYHGGVKGHMPAGSWRDILNTLRDISRWKLCLDIEAATWEVLLRDDPAAYRELKNYLEESPDSRVEMVAGTFSQPYGWAISGESNIRQLQRGAEIIHRHFPKAAITTYAVQEPCWSSALPQILLSLGFNGAVLKDPGTAWGGYSAGFDADIVNWTGPDGSAIAAVPRYACEELRKVYETESAYATPEFARKCVAHGIPHPAGMYFQDLGWAAKPRVSADYIRYVTWREYLHGIGDKPSKEWRFSPEDILTTLPWGEQTLQAVAQQERSAENRLVAAEKAASIAWLVGNSPWPGDRLRDAWDSLLWAQGHDAWITATTRTGRQAWAFQVASGTLDAETAGGAIIAESLRTLCSGPEQTNQHSGNPEQTRTPLGSQWVRVANTLGIEREDLAELTIATDRGTHSLRMFDAAGNEVPCQIAPSRRYSPLSRTSAPAESINAATILFRPRVPSIGYASYRVEPQYSEQSSNTSSPQERVVSVTTEAGGKTVMESDLYRLEIDPKRGGAITSLYAKQLKKEFCESSAPRAFNEYAGYFIAQKQWRSSAENPARIMIVESGPLRGRVRIAGQVGGCPFQTVITLAEGQRRIDFQSRFTFEQETWIGDPWDMKPEERRSEPRRSQNDGRWKLQAFFPVSLRNHAVYKNAAYDVCRSRNSDTFFQRWDEIKHNIIVNWVDLLDEREKTGLAVFSDHTTAYTHGPDHPLALVLGWGWEGGFWWGKCPLKGVLQSAYGIIPHAGAWDEARLSEESSRWNEPLNAELMDGGPKPDAASRSLVSVTGGGIEVPTILVDGRHLLLRLFNGEGDAQERTVSLYARPVRVDIVELNGRVSRSLTVQHAGNGRYEVKVAMPRFGIRTLRCEMNAAQG
jgi:alpha-mannosidase